MKYLILSGSGNDPKNDFTQFLKNNALWICLGIVGLILITILVIYIIKAPGRKANKAQPINNDEWLLALGGKDNIKEINRNGSRMSVNLKDENLIEREKLTALGVSSVVKMSNKVTLVVSKDSQKIFESIKKVLEN